MKNPFKNSRHGSGKSDTKDREANAHQPENAKKEIRVLYEDPIMFGQVPESVEESPTPPDNSSGTPVFLIGGSMVALLCLWWLAPEWLGGVWKNFLNQILHLAGQ